MMSPNTGWLGRSGTMRTCGGSPGCGALPAFIRGDRAWVPSGGGLDEIWWLGEIGRSGSMIPASVEGLRVSESARQSCELFGRKGQAYEVGEEVELNRSV